jgi:uncharacterized Ntn-hydrolase superfamily protein
MPGSILADVTLEEELERIATAAERHADGGERLTGVLPAEPHGGERVYLCAFEAEGPRRAWLALDAGGEAVTSRRLLRDAASIAALCELAEEVAGGGQLDELRSQLVALRLTENPPGIDDAEEAVRVLERTIEQPPRVASPDYLDRIGAATRRLEQALGEGGSPFAEGMKHGMAAVEELAKEIEGSYKTTLS